MVSWQVRDKMERQGAQVKKLEANHSHLISRNNFKVLIFQVSQSSERVRVTLFGEEWLQELNWNVRGEQMELFCSRLKVSFLQPQKAAQQVTEGHHGMVEGLCVVTS